LSNTSDSFIDEVTEEVRRDRLFGYLRRYGWIGILAVLLLVGGAAYTEYQRNRTQAAAEALGDALYAAVAQGEPAAQAQAIAAVGATGPSAAPALMLEAAALAEAGDTEAAAARLAALAADATQSRVWRDLATLKRIALLGSALPPDARLAELEAVSTAGAPYRVLAQEMAAMAHLDAGEPARAAEILESLLTDQESTAGLRLRAAQLMVAIGAGPEAAGTDGSGADDEG
jgi:hypothetical protein